MLIEGTQYEQPSAGLFLGTIIDVVDLGSVKSRFDGSQKIKIRVVWVLDKNDSKGRPFFVIGTYNAVINEKSNLYAVVKNVTGQIPAVPFDTEILVGHSNQLFLEQTTAPDGRKWTNVKGILPLAEGQKAPEAPTGFVRAQDRKNQPANGSPLPTAAAPIANATANTAVNVPPAAAVGQDDDIAF